MGNQILQAEDLSFLKLFDGDRRCEYRNSQYLTTPFDSDVFRFDFGTGRRFSIDFRVKLEDGSLLTSESNRSLLEIFKCWPCIQTHIDVTGSSIYSAETAYNAVRRAVSLIDYFLLDSKYFKLSLHGLSSVTENDIICLLAQVAASSNISTSIYQWPTRLSDYLRSELANADFSLLNEVIRRHSFLELDIPDEEDRMLNLTENEIIFSRALLWSMGYYKKYYDANHLGESYRFSPRTETISQLIYSNTLRGGLKKPQPSELLLDPIQRYDKEYSRAPVRSVDDDRLSEREWSRYRSTIRSLGNLVEIGAAVPVSALNEIRENLTQDAVLLKATKRYRSLPQKLVLDSLRKGVEFALTYGAELLESVVTVIGAAKKSGSSCIAFAAENDIRPLLSPKIRSLGVRVWHLGYHMNSVERSSIRPKSARPSSNDYFLRMRNNEGLYELLRTFFGAAQLCIGVLMARRQGEFLDLIAGQALDQGKTFLVFFNRKTGVGGMRRKEARPIPSVAVRIIELLEHFHERLIAIGVSSGKAQLFAYPNLHTGTPVKLRSPQYNASLDIFCDYTQTPLNNNGERYYLRQHQLRRFFAMIFFWGNSFGGMDTLRWFLGHTDIEHLYHYITESTPGNILRGAKAHFGSELLKNRPEETPQLADIVEKHFGTREFSVLDSDELDDYLDDLLIDGRVEIEPQFFEGTDGKAFRIAVKILEMERLNNNG